MPARELPARPNLEQYKKQAKELVKAFRSGDNATLQRVREHHPHPARDSFELADAQLVIAREHGVDSWPKFKQQIECASDQVPPEVWKKAEDAIVAGDVVTLERILRAYGDLMRKQRPQSSWNNTLAPEYDAGDARAIIARTHHFKTFEDFVAFTQTIKDKSSPVARFEAAVDAIVAGDLDSLRRLLREGSDLVRARSVRVHRSTLLHYVGANGVEGFRQHTPSNAVAIAEALLEAGAEIDAVAGMYRGSTTLALVATSLHPKRAGVQQALIQLLLDRGATLDHPATGGGRSLVHSCLANGRPEAAKYLVSRGAALDFETAAPLGRLDVVRSYFDADGRPSVTKAQMESALVSASINDAMTVVQFLLERGVDVDAQSDGFSGVNAAATGGCLDTVRLFLSRGASLETRNRYGGTSLGGALWGALNSPEQGDYVAVIDSLLAAGARIESGMTKWWRKEASSALAYARILELLEAYSHQS
jgi:ankyrin repeat protein